MKKQTPGDSPDVEDNSGLVQVSDFDFPGLSEALNFVMAPDTSFTHVEASLNTGIKEGMVVEMPIVKNSTEQFWLANIQSVHGSFLRLSYVASENVDEIWYDLSCNKLYPLGWCQMNKMNLQPPEDIKKRCPEWQKLALQCLEDVSIDTISDHFSREEGIMPFNRLKKGMVLKIQDRIDPNIYRSARIVGNHGGMLHLDVKIGGKEMLFYTSARLAPIHFVKDDDDDDIPVPNDVIVRFTPEKHSFKKGNILEIIPPLSDKVKVARVNKIWNPYYFQVTELDTETKYLCHRNSSFIFPIGWSEKYAKIESSKASNINEEMKPAANEYFPKKSIIGKKTFDKRQKLEIFCHGNKMRTGTITDVWDSVLVLQLDHDDETKRQKILLPFPNENIFPFGWSNTNGMPCSIPKTYVTMMKEIEAKLTEVNVKDERETPRKVVKESGAWCPLIYFNYKCYSASFLSKVRLASLPMQVGPGSAHLVVKKVLELIIRASYKSGTVLKNLAVDPEKQPRKDFVVESFKSKVRSSNCKADIEVPTRADQVNQYCREVCQKLGACPYLLSPTLYDKECPANCQSKPKSEFHAEEQSGILFKNKSRRNPRKRKQGETNGLNNNTNAISSSEVESNDTSDPTSVANSRSATPENLQDETVTKPAKKKRKEWENILPKSGIQTRGAKLPDFKVHFRMRPSKKDQKAMEETDLKEGGEKKSNKKGNLEAAFKISDIPPPAPPPVREICLKSNPICWTCREVAFFVAQTCDIGHMAELMIDGEIDGMAFMLLTFPIMIECWNLTIGSAIKLCQHVESVKKAYIEQYLNN